MSNREKVFRVKERCPNCSGSGVYIGSAERDGFGVVCSTCDGSGCHIYTHRYIEFKKRRNNKKIMWVLEANPGLCVGLKGKDRTFKYEDFGGISYKEWLKTKSFPKRAEMRGYVCPAWWYQSADNSKKADDILDCLVVGSFKDCKNFKNKDKCWKNGIKYF